MSTIKKIQIIKIKKQTITSEIFKYFYNQLKDNKDIKYEDCLVLAKKVKNKTKFNKQHFSFYVNKYNNLTEKELLNYLNIN